MNAKEQWHQLPSMIYNPYDWLPSFSNPPQPTRIDTTNKPVQTLPTQTILPQASGPLGYTLSNPPVPNYHREP